MALVQNNVVLGFGVAFVVALVVFVLVSLTAGPYMDSISPGTGSLITKAGLVALGLLFLIGLAIAVSIVSGQRGSGCV